MADPLDAATRLENLRRRIRHLDAALLGLVAERMELAREIGAAKRAAEIPLRDFEVERRVLDRAAATAAEMGLEPEVARAVMGQLIDEACRVQEEEHYSRYSGDAETALVVGGMGKMGRWLTRFLANQGHRVRIHDTAATAATAGPGEAEVAENLDEGLRDASLAFVATPLEAVGPSIERIAATGFRGVVCDIASLKAHLRPSIERARAGGTPVASIHPMFGPGTRTLSDKVIVLCDCGDPAASERIAGLFGDTAARLVPLGLEEHDRIASYVLGLSHFVNLLFARVLAESGLDRGSIDAVGSTTFRAQFATALSVLRENPALYYEIQRLNPDSGRVYAGVRAALADWTRWIESGDAESFTAAMLGGRRWLEE